MKKIRIVIGFMVVMLLCMMMGTVISKSLESEINEYESVRSNSIFIDFAQHSASTTGDFVFLTDDGRVYEIDPSIESRI